MKKILVIDNFDSFTFNLVDYFLQLGCEVKVYRNTVDPKVVEEVHPDLIVFSPGPSVPKNAGRMMEIIDLYHKNYPMLGVCLGHEAFVEYFGGSLKLVEPVHGRASAIDHDGKTIFEGLENGFMAGRYHSLVADEVPECFEVTATCPAGTDGSGEELVMAIRHKELPIEGVQFHPESVLSMKGGNGFKMIENVVIAKATILQTIEDNKKKEVEQRKVERPLESFRDQLSPASRDFAGALRAEGISLIAEVKQASPSEGVIMESDFDPARIAVEYEEAGARALSVLCDREFFKGDLLYLKAAAEATVDVPILCKDFIINEYQIYEARSFGADAILLIKALLSNEEIDRFIEIVEELGMDALCEVHTAEELEAVLATKAEIIGINNRDLHSFEIDLGTTAELVKMIPAGKIVVAESGIASREDVASLPAEVDAILVGTSLMKADDMTAKINELING